MVQLIEHTSTIIEIIFNEDIKHIKYMVLERLENGELNRESHQHDYSYENKSIIIKNSLNYLQIIIVLYKLNDIVNESTITINKKEEQGVNIATIIKEI